MTMELVNGIACYNCTDVEKAKKAGLNGTADTQDPLHPSTKISTPHKTDGVNDVKDSVSVSGVDSSDDSSDTSNSNPDSSNADPSSANQPLASGDRGTKLNFSV